MADNKQTVHVKVLSPKETLFEGEAIAVSSTNSQGKFDILPQHANFVTMTKDAPIIVLTPQQEKITFNLPLAIMYTTADTVSIYTDIIQQDHQ